MADINYIVPGAGLIQDTEEGSEVIIPAEGIYQQQPVPVGPGGFVVPLAWHHLNKNIGAS